VVLLLHALSHVQELTDLLDDLSDYLEEMRETKRALAFAQVGIVLINFVMLRITLL
jgi:hypothetical protein